MSFANGASAVVALGSGRFPDPLRFAAVGSLPLPIGEPLNERQNRVIRAARRASRFGLCLENAPVRVTDAAQRLEIAVADASDAELQQRRARYLRKAPPSG